MQFMVTAWDDTDPAAPERRKAARPAHLDGIGDLKTAGNFIAGGAILDDAGNMIGSTVYVEFDSREELDAWLNRDPYVTGGVWKNITVHPVRLAFRD